VTGDRDDDPEGPPWHERTSTVVGASVVGLMVIGIVYLLASYLSSEFNTPDQAPQYYIDEPGSTSKTYSTSTTTTTTETVTSTSPPVTTDINGDETTTTSSSTDTTSGPTYPPSTHRTTYDNGESTTRKPRFNETRTLYPQP
jgi:hypothetical protein